MKFATIRKDDEGKYFIRPGATFDISYSKYDKRSFIHPESGADQIEVSDELLGSPDVLVRHFVKYGSDGKYPYSDHAVTLLRASLRWNGSEPPQILVPEANSAAQSGELYNASHCVWIPGYQYEYEEQSRPIFRQIIRRGLIVLYKGDAVDVRAVRRGSKKVKGTWNTYESYEEVTEKFTVSSDGEKLRIEGVPLLEEPPICFA